jgi:hypothetical protein
MGLLSAVCGKRVFMLRHCCSTSRYLEPLSQIAQREGGRGTQGGEHREARPGMWEVLYANVA